MTAPTTFFATGALCGVVSARRRCVAAKTTKFSEGVLEEHEARHPTIVSYNQSMQKCRYFTKASFRCIFLNSMLNRLIDPDEILVFDDRMLKKIMLKIPF